MQFATISEVRRNISQLVNQVVEDDEHLLITRQGKPVAVLSSYDAFHKSEPQLSLEPIGHTSRVFVHSPDDGLLRVVAYQRVRDLALLEAVFECQVCHEHLLISNHISRIKSRKFVE